MSGSKHPARRARRIVALASGASYIGLTASIAVATTLSNDAEEVETAIVPAAATNGEPLALQLDGSATPVPATEPEESTTTRPTESSTTVDLFADSSTSQPAGTPLPNTPATTSAPQVIATAPPTTAAATTAAPTTAAPTTAAPTTTNGSTETTAAPTTGPSTTVAPTTTAAPTTAAPTTTATPPTTQVTATTSGAS